MSKATELEMKAALMGRSARQERIRETMARRASRSTPALDYKAQAEKEARRADAFEGLLKKFIPVMAPNDPNRAEIERTIAANKR